MDLEQRTHNFPVWFDSCSIISLHKNGWEKRNIFQANRLMADLILNLIIITGVSLFFHFLPFHHYVHHKICTNENRLTSLNGAVFFFHLLCCCCCQNLQKQIVHCNYTHRLELRIQSKYTQYTPRTENSKKGSNIAMVFISHGSFAFSPKSNRFVCFSIDICIRNL